jgi:hypothetical protein
MVAWKQWRTALFGIEKEKPNTNLIPESLF